jgi:excisionase family DNA binding protein
VAVLGLTVPRYLSVADAARVAGFSPRAVYRAIDRGELGASVVCSRLRIHPDDFLAWMEGDRAEARERPRSAPRAASRKVPAPNGLRALLEDRRPAA